VIAVAPLRKGEIETLCALARTVWRAHYPPIIGDAQTEYMLSQRYDPAIIAAELERKDVWWDTLSEEDRMVAFASSIAIEAEQVLKLDKLYVHPERQRMGCGGVLLEHTCRRAERMGYSKVVLAVNKRNVNAIGAYRKYGFRIAEAVVKDIGGGFVMDDYVMEKSVNGDRAPGACRT
jgi:ribosomal protein S18 acetylase RimI-like enzyme